MQTFTTMRKIIKVITLVPDTNVCRKKHVSSADWRADGHGDVWMFRSRGVCELQVSNGDHVLC